MQKTLLLHLTLACIFFGINSCSTDSVPDNSNASGFDEKYELTIDSVLASLTLDEKVRMVYGNGIFTSPGVERFGLPDLQYADGPTGIREELEFRSWKSLGWTTDSVTFFPTGTALAATWNKDLAFRYGKAIGREARARKKDILLGPGVNIIRTPLCGRNFEYFSEDPLLASVMTVGYVCGVQMQDVAACVKHFAVNNQEYMRGQINVEMDERTLREIYLPVYKAAALEAEAYSFMGSYNKFRGDYLCENDYLQNEILKKEWGYKGAIVSDWGATHSTVKAALNGLDIEMGNPWGKGVHHMSTLADSVKAGLVPESVVDDKVRRILRIIYNCRTNDPARKTGSMNTPENSELAYDVASEAIVLLKNEEKTLPLKENEIEKIAVIGMMADKTLARGGYTAGVKARYEITPLEGLKRRVGDKIKIQYAPGYKEEFTRVDTGGRRLYRYPAPTVNDTLLQAAIKTAKGADYVLFFAGNPRTVETEATDRETLTFPFGQDSVLKAIAAVNPNIIVIVVAGAASDLRAAAKLSSALLYSWFNGSENGNALAGMLFGDVNPSGKLPFTIPVKIEDVGAHSFDKGAYPGRNGTVEYKEGILVGYRWFDTKTIEPAYCFGYGLSYTEFEISGVKSNKMKYTTEETIRLEVEVKNSGNTIGKETVQVYVRKPDSEVKRADKELKAFAKLELAPGTSVETELYIPAEKLAYYNSGQKKWMVEPGEYTLLVGNSSGNITQEVAIRLE